METIFFGSNNILINNYTNLIEYYNILQLNKSIYNKIKTNYINKKNFYIKWISKYNRQLIYLLGGYNKLCSSYIINKPNIYPFSQKHYNNYYIFTLDIFNKPIIIISYLLCKKFGPYIYKYRDLFIIKKYNNKWFIDNKYGDWYGIIIDNSIITNLGIEYRLFLIKSLEF